VIVACNFSMFLEPDTTRCAQGCRRDRIFTASVLTLFIGVHRRMGAHGSSVVSDTYAPFAALTLVQALPESAVLVLRPL
jgi:hypothetical protein